MNCGKRFYIYGKEEEAINKLSDAIISLRMLEYPCEIPSIWKMIQERAKCCSEPNISIVKWKC